MRNTKQLPAIMGSVVVVFLASWTASARPDEPARREAVAVLPGADLNTTPYATWGKGGLTLAGIPGARVAVGEALLLDALAPCPTLVLESPRVDGGSFLELRLELRRASGEHATLDLLAQRPRVVFHDVREGEVIEASATVHVARGELPRAAASPLRATCSVTASSG